MTYLAPRQGLFAIIILVSFCLQTLLLVISTDQQLSKSRELKGEQMVAQLIDEARLSLENQDRVSLSVIANRYTSEQDVARLVIKNNKDEILVPVGNAPLQQGETISQIATNGDAVIGSVALTLKEVSKGEIITMQWPFVIGSMILHLLLLLVYSYVARPTKEQINTLSREIENIHRDQYALRAQTHSRYRSETVSDANNDSHSAINEPLADTAETTNVAPVSTTNIHNELNAYLKSQQAGSKEDGASESVVDEQDKQAQTNSATTPASDKAPINSNATSVTTDSRKSSTTANLSSSRPLERVGVHITFHDEYQMLELLAPETRTPYLALCTQLLQQALAELLKQPLLLGVSAVNKPYFDENGALIVLKAENSHAKVALAGVMLAKLYLMLNKIIHDKHVELSRFALPAKAGVSDEAQSAAMTQLLKTVGKKEQMLILLPSAGMRQIGSYVQLQSVKRPTTVYERECAVFDGGNDAMMQRLADVRNSVLTTESSPS